MRPTPGGTTAGRGHLHALAHGSVPTERGAGWILCDKSMMDYLADEGMDEANEAYDAFLEALGPGLPPRHQLRSDAPSPLPTLSPIA